MWTGCDDAVAAPSLQPALFSPSSSVPSTRVHHGWRFIDRKAFSTGATALPFLFCGVRRSLWCVGELTLVLFGSEQAYRCQATGQSPVVRNKDYASELVKEINGVNTLYDNFQCVPRCCCGLSCVKC